MYQAPQVCFWHLSQSLQHIAVVPVLVNPLMSNWDHVDKKADSKIPAIALTNVDKERVKEWRKVFFRSSIYNSPEAYISWLEENVVECI